MRAMAMKVCVATRQELSWRVEDYVGALALLPGEARTGGAHLLLFLPDPTAFCGRTSAAASCQGVAGGSSELASRAGE